MVLNRLAPMIEERVREEVCLLINSTDEVNKLATKLKKIQQVFRDVEQKGVTDPKVKSWLDKLQGISYESDDVLDEWDWENIRLQMEELEDASESSDPWEKVSSFLQSVCLCLRRVVGRRNINLNIKQLNERIDLIGKENENEFKFVPNLSDDSQDFKRIVTTSFVDVSKVHGRDDDKEILVSKLLYKSSNQMKNGVPNISGIEELTNRCTLSQVFALGGIWKNLGLLRNLNRLGGSLTICIYVTGLDNTDDLVEAAEKADLKNKNLILRLQLGCSWKVPFQVMEALELHPNLEILEIIRPLLTLTNLRKLILSHGWDQLADDHMEMGSFYSLPHFEKLLPFLEILFFRFNDWNGTPDKP